MLPEEYTREEMIERVIEWHGAGKTANALTCGGAKGVDRRRLCAVIRHLA
jgi:hypothetical protein